MPARIDGDASSAPRQKYLRAIRGAAVGGSYALALATDYILMSDDGGSMLALRRVPGGLER
jgi:enoyl-CoA hydratase/carnithine racemase